MYRYNSQLGNYCTISKVDVVKATKATTTVDYYGGTKSFDSLGNERKPKSSIYGTSTYNIYSEERARKLFDGEKFNQYRISSGKELLLNIG